MWEQASLLLHNCIGLKFEHSLVSIPLIEFPDFCEFSEKILKLLLLFVAVSNERHQSGQVSDSDLSFVFITNPNVMNHRHNSAFLLSM